MKNTSNEDVWQNGENERDDEGRPPERDVVEMTEQLYRDTFWGEKQADAIWIISPITKIDRDRWHHSDVNIMLMRVFAEKMEGKFRFAYIDRHGPYYKHFQMIFGWNVFPLNYIISPDKYGGHLVEEMKIFIEDYSTWMELFHNAREMRHLLIDDSFTLWRYPNPVVNAILRFDKMLFEDYRDYY